MILTVGNTKGGVGKSTIACNLAIAAAMDGKKVLLIDADVQASSSGFRASREDDIIKAMTITTPTLHKDLSDLKQAVDMIIIDAGGRDSNVFRSAVSAADILLIPCLPSQVDFWAVNDVIEIYNLFKPIKKINAYFLLNQIMPNTNLSKEAQEAIKEFSEEIDPLNTFLASRIAYKNAFGAGKSVIEWSDPKAKDEILRLYGEIKKIEKEIA